MPPFADAVRLVNGQQVHPPSLQVSEASRQHQPLRGNVEQPELSVMQPAQPRPRFPRRQRRVQEGRRHAAGLQGVHLVLHQRDQRRYHHRQPGPRHGRQLKAKRLAAAGRQQREHVLARQHIADDLLLERAEGSEAEVLLQQRQQLRDAGFHTGSLRQKGPPMHA